MEDEQAELEALGGQRERADETGGVAEPEGPPLDSEERLLSRRRFLSGAMVGGAAGLAVAAGASVAVWAELDAQNQQRATEAEAEIARLQGLVQLYERLERVGLDAILQTGMTAVTLPLAAVELGARALRQGLDLIEGALRQVQEALPKAQEAFDWLERQVTAVAHGLEALSEALSRFLEKVGDTPVAERLGEVTALILDKLPFGWGDKIRASFDGLVALVGQVDDLVEGVNSRVLEPIEQKWFSAEPGVGIGGVLIQPLIEHLLDPLEAHLDDLATLSDSWRDKLEAPTKQALKERESVRLEIARYREENGL